MSSITWHNWLNDPPTVFSATLILFTVSLAVVGAIQIRVSRSTSRRQLRAYIFVDSYNVGNGSTQVPPVDNMLRVPWAFISIRNSGQTPAYNIRHVAKVDVRRTEDEKELKIAPNLEPRSRAFAGPGGGLTKFWWFDRPISDEEMADIKSGQRSLFVYGRVEYLDAFKQKQWLSYKLRYNGSFPPTQLPSLTFCDSDNEAS